ncbi:LacI family DNA-binding transcriptional regulator [Consotaella sp. CSK11QG-6]
MVAEEASVSIATASKALNGRGQMMPQTRERVREVAQRLGFRPNAMARALLTQRSLTVGLLTTDTYGRFTLPVAGGLSKALVDKGVSVFLCAVDDDAERGRLHLEAMQEKCVDGLIAAGKRIDGTLPVDLHRSGLPIIHVMSQCPDGDIGFVPDDRQGAQLATEHLLALGRRRIAHVTGRQDFLAARLRAESWQKTLIEAGAQPFSHALFGSWTEAWGYEAARILFADPPWQADRPDAVFCGNDQIARGLIDGLTAQGLGVPGDVAVVGFDNWEIFSAATRPPLSTIDMDLDPLGRQAGLALLDLIGGKPIAPGVRTMPCRLVVRESCGADRRSNGMR